MIYKHRAVLRKLLKKGAYDPVKGVTMPDLYRETLIPCEISQMAEDLKQTLFGDFRVDAFHVRLQRKYSDRIDEVLIDGSAYDLIQVKESGLRGGYSSFMVTRK